MAVYDVDVTTGILTFDDTDAPYPITSKLVNDGLELIINGYGHYYIKDGVAYVDGNPFVQTDRKLTVIGSIYLVSGDTFLLATEDIVRFSVYTDIGQALPIGATPTASLVLSLNNLAGKWNIDGPVLNGRNLDGATVSLKLGAMNESDTYEFFSLGLFIIESVDNQEQNPVITIKGSDYMGNKMMTQYVDEMTYPTTYGEIIADACLQAGVTLETTTYVFYGEPISTAPALPEGATCRDVVGWIACLIRANAFISRDGGVIVRPMLSVASEKTIDASRYIQLNVNNFPLCTNFTMSIYPVGAPADTSPRTFSYGIGGPDGRVYQLEVRNNPYIFHADGDAVNDGIAQLTGFIGYWMVTRGSGRVAWHGDEGLLICDTVDVEKTNGHIIRLGVLQQRIEYGPETGLIFESGCDLSGITLIQSNLKYGWGE